MTHTMPTSIAAIHSLRSLRELYNSKSLCALCVKFSTHTMPTSIAAIHSLRSLRELYNSKSLCALCVKFSTPNPTCCKFLNSANPWFRQSLIHYKHSHELPKKCKLYVSFPLIRHYFTKTNSTK